MLANGFISIVLLNYMMNAMHHHQQVVRRRRRTCRFSSSEIMMKKKKILIQNTLRENKSGAADEKHNGRWGIEVE